MRFFILLSILFFGIAAHAEDTALPATLPAAPDELAAMDAEFPQEFQLASNDDAAVFEFPEIVLPKEVKKDVVAAAKPQDWEEQMRNALVAKGAGEKIAIDGIRYGRTIKEAQLNAAEWQVQDVVYDTKTSRFSGKLVAEGQESITFRGRYGAMQSVPVFTKRMQRGVLVTEQDIVMKPILAMRVRNTMTLLKPEDVIGKTLKRTMIAGQPIRTNDLVEQVAVLANSEVQMLYDANGIVVTDRGIALEKGSIGDVIKVKNVKSGAILRAKVEAPNRVSVNYFDAAPVAMLGEQNARN